jgi:hypothetical protein
VSDAIPREVLSEHLQERLAGKRLLGAVFLTFQYDPGFFEQEILPVLLDTPVSHAQVARLLQLEGALREVPLGVAVFYDWAGLYPSDYPAPRLDVHRFPVRVGTGIFHPKNILLLTEDRDADGEPKQRLFVATLSANLTRTGWWENVEACHIEELEDGQQTRLRTSLVTLLDRVERLTANKAAIEVLRPYRKFVLRLEQGGFKSRNGELWPHLIVCGGGDGDDLADFLKAHIPPDGGYRLEVLSPFLDKEPGTKSPLRALTKALSPDEVRVYLPQDDAGKALCSESAYAHVAELGDRVSWATLPGEVIALGRSADAGRRSVHAKVYRIFKPHPKTEYLFVGSVNLTAPAHSGSGGNLETGILVQIDPPSRPDFWLRPLGRKPAVFEAVTPEDEPDTDAILPLQVRFSWKSHEASARWEGLKPPPILTLLSSSGPLGDDLVLPKRDWMSLPAALATQLEEALKSSSIITARAGDGRECKVLVQEEDMPLKPELLRVLPVQDILQYWSLLRPEQRQAFLDSRASVLSPDELGGLMVVVDDGEGVGNDMFARCAGVFHAFAQLEARVLEALDEDRPRQAAALMFGERFDSLATVLDRVLGEDDATADSSQQTSQVDRYLMLMCAVQLCDRVRVAAIEFWKEYRAQAVSVTARLEARTHLREALCASEPEKMGPFMDWFDHWFLKRAEAVEV